MESDPDANFDWNGDERRTEERRAQLVGKATIFLALVLATAALAFDLSLPLGVAGGVPYVALVLLGVWFSKPYHVYLLATLGSVLTIVGYLASPGGGIYWVVITNRWLALFAIWVTAFLIASRKRYEDQLIDAKDHLEEQVIERTHELREKNALVDLLHRVAVAANRAMHVEEAMMVCLKEICAYTGWPIGHVYTLSTKRPGIMAPTTIWHIEDEARFANFKKITEQTEFKSGEGLPGRVMQSGEPLWIRDVSEDPNFPRAKLTDDIVSHTGFGLPVKVGEEVVAVLEFFSTKINEPDETLLHVVDNIGTQLGRVIERNRTQVNLVKLYRAIDQSHTMVQITDTEGKIEYANPRLLEFMGFTAHQVIGKNPRIFKSGETPKEIYEGLWQTIKSGADWSGEIKNRRRNGDTFWASMAVSPVKDETGRMTHFVATYEDLTVRREAERAIRQTQKMESLGSLSGGIAHDINNMLVPIINLTSTAIDSLPKDRKEQKYLGSVVKAAEQVKALVEKIVAFSRQEKGKLEEIDAADMVRESVELIKTALPSTIKLKLEIDGRAEKICVDKSQISSVLINLAANSFDAMEGQTGELKITLSRAKVGKRQADKVANLKTGNYARIAVCDTGTGMSNEILQRALDPFFTTKAVGKGTGMGLAMAYGIMSNHGGALDISSSLGHGATVTIYLPLIIGRA